MSTQQVITLVVVLATFVLPALQKMFKSMQEQAAKRQAALKRERDELEALRTGRTPAARTPSAMDTLSQRAEGASAPFPSSSPPLPRPSPSQPAGVKTRTIRLPGGIVLEVPDEETEAPRTQPSPSQPSTQTPPARPNTRPPLPRPAKAARTPRPAKSAPNRGRGRSDEERSSSNSGSVGVATATAGFNRSEVAGSLLGMGGAADAARAAGTKTTQLDRSASAAQLALLGRALDRAELRRAFVMNEVLSRPVSDR